MSFIIIGSSIIIIDNKNAIDCIREQMLYMIKRKINYVRK